jgi:acyl-CoA dehydrogenase
VTVDLGRHNRPAFQELLEKAQRVGQEVARAHAGDVDEKARFPHESFAALRKERLLSASVPEEFGGAGCTIDEISQICTALGQHCASTAMVYAMHTIQVASVVRFATGAPWFRKLLGDLSERQILIASATSEQGTGGDLRSSICCVETEGDRIKVEKKATVCSYGEHGDAILLTARRAPESPPSDQVMVLLMKGDYTLEQTSVWNTFGMRGTCSPGFVIRATGSAEQVLPAAFADIAAQSQVPYSHLVWSSLWLGIATDAVARAHAFVRADARKRPGTLPFGGQRLAEAQSMLQSMRANIHDALRAYADLLAAPDGAELLSSMGCAIRWNNVKILASEAVVAIVREALAITGMAGFSNEGKFSMGRALRDATSAALMIANDRIHTTNANLMLVYKDE